MPQLGRFDYTIQTPLGLAVTGGSCAIYREGATVNGNQSGVSPTTFTVRHSGKIVTGDSVFVNATTGTTYAATVVSATSITLSGYGGNLSLTNGDRLTPSGTQPTLYGDDQAGATTANPLTSSSTGRVNCWMECGPYDFVISGGGATTTAFTSQIVSDVATLEMNVKSFGAKGDNSTNDSTAIQAAITEASATVNAGIGTYVYLPRGTYILNAQITVKNKVRLIGAGRSGTVLKAGAGVAPATGLIRLGDGTGNVFGCRLENLTVDCNNESSSIGVYSSETQEQSGLDSCVVTNFRSYGVQFNTGSQHAGVERCEIYGSTSFGGALAGVYLNAVAGIHYVRRCTINGQTQTMTDAILVNASTGDMDGIHCETVTNGIRFTGAGATGTLIHAFGKSDVTNLVKIDASASNTIALIGLYPNGGTNVVNDARTTKTLDTATAGNVGWYLLGAGAGSSALVLTSGSTVGGWNLHAAVGDTVLTFTDLATTPSVAGGNSFLAANSGATVITNFTNGLNGQLITIIFSNANTTINNTATIKNRTGGNITPGANTTRSYKFDGATWYEAS